ncbi:MAG: GNAT family N-acetyltransferase [Herpetosiphonaceae bacterium]|nr:GNAT family N-acetyltransferase [Herpetosiphonaceae bacterium]
MATEAASAVCDYAFRSLHLPQLISLIRQANKASAQVAEKVGMRLTAELTRYSHTYWVYALACGDAPVTRPVAVLE